MGHGTAATACVAPCGGRRCYKGRTALLHGASGVATMAQWRAALLRTAAGGATRGERRQLAFLSAANGVAARVEQQCYWQQPAVLSAAENVATSSHRRQSLVALPPANRMARDQDDASVRSSGERVALA